MQFSKVYGKAAIFAAAGAAVISSPALAQETRKLDFGLHAGVEHNSNVARTPPAQAALRGLSLADTVFTPNATANVVLPVGRQAVFLNGVVGYSFYEKNSKLNRERLNIDGGVRGRFGPCAPTLRAAYSRGISQYDDPILVDDVRNVLETKTVGFDVACARPTGLGIVAGVSRDWNENSLALSKLADSERTSMNVGVSYSRPALGTLTVFYNRAKAEYPNRLIEDGYDLDAVGLSYRRELGARIQGTISVTYNRIDPHAVFVGGDVETMGYSANVTYRATNRLRLTALLDRSVTPSTAIGRAYDLTDVYRVMADYDLGSRIKLGLGLSKVDRESDGIAGLPIVQLTDSSVEAINASVRYKQSERLSFTLVAGREERTTNAPQFDYTNDRIGLSADLAF
jgi:hypothetical protein